MGLFDIFKKQNPHVNIKKSIYNETIYCQLNWDRSLNTIQLYGYNKSYNLNLLCAHNLFIREYNHTTRPYDNIYIPRIIYDIDWHFIFNEGIELKSFSLIFSNYMESTRIYSVILEAKNMKNKIIRDTFSSTTKVFIDPFELTDNIKRFLKYAEKYK